MVWYSRETSLRTAHCYSSEKHFDPHCTYCIRRTHHLGSSFAEGMRVVSSIDWFLLANAEYCFSSVDVSDSGSPLVLGAFESTLRQVGLRNRQPLGTDRK